MVLHPGRARPDLTALPARSFSGTPFAGVYFIVQALAIVCWWVSLAQFPAMRRHFIASGAAEADLLAFMAPDLMLAAPSSLAAGITCLRRSSWSLPLCWLASGAMLYAFLYCLGWSVLRDGAWLGVALMAPAAVLSAIAALDASGGALTIFRRATPSTQTRHVTATLSQIAVFWGFFLGLVPLLIRWIESRLAAPPFEFGGQQLLAASVFAGFSALGLASAYTMAVRGAGTPLPMAATNRLVITGPYAYLRNPMVVAGLGQGCAVGLSLGSWAVLAYAILGGLLWQLLARPAEERDLVEQFGREYVDYRAHVRCWVPRLRPFSRAPALEQTTQG